MNGQRRAGGVAPAAGQRARTRRSPSAGGSSAPVARATERAAAPRPAVPDAAALAAVSPAADSEDAAQALIDLMPLIMQSVRVHMRAGRGPGLSVAQFRVLAYVHYQPGVSLTAAAGHVGLGAPAASALVEGLVRRRLIDRRPAASDRRRVVLDLLPAGRDVLERARREAMADISARLAPLAPAQRADVGRVLRLIQPLFAGTSPGTPAIP